MAPPNDGHGDRDDASSTIARTNSSSSSRSSSITSRRSDKYRRRRRSRHTAAALRTLAFFSSVIAALCGGSITVFSLYGHIFQERLHYTQLQVNGLAISSSIALYLPVSALGYLCDRAGARPLALLAALLFGGGYGIAAGTYRKLDIETANGLRGAGGRLIIVGDGSDGEPGSGTGTKADWTYPLMMFAFVCVGVGTCSLYLAAVATNAKNFGKGRHRGLALAVPIAAFGLSGMWLSLLSSHVFYERRPDGSRGDLDVFQFFVFLSILLIVVGIVGSFTLRVVDEEDMIEEAAEELERSGLLDRSALLDGSGRGYGAASFSEAHRHRDANETDHDDPEYLGTRGARGAFEQTPAAGGSVILDPNLDSHQAQRKKDWLLNAETRRFLADRTMWCLALGFLLMIGPGEAFINNLGTVIGTLNPPASRMLSGDDLDGGSGGGGGVPTSASTHVSIVALTSTAARLLTGTLTDLLAPSPDTQHLQVEVTARPPFVRGVSLSRVTFLLFFAIVLSLGLLSLASGAIQGHAERFWLASGLIGAGYGAVFSLTPIIITVIWGVENFATNWGIVAMFPALGATFWGLVYSAIYQAGATANTDSNDDDTAGAAADVFCYGKQCYVPTFWAMTVTVWLACFMVLYAWKGRGGWAQRGIVI